MCCRILPACQALEEATAYFPKITVGGPCWRAWNYREPTTSIGARQRQDEVAGVRDRILTLAGEIEYDQRISVAEKDLTAACLASDNCIASDWCWSIEEGSVAEDRRRLSPRCSLKGDRAKNVGYRDEIQKAEASTRNIAKGS